MTQDRNALKAEDPAYAHVNVFVGKYKVPANGALALPKARVRILYGREDEVGFVTDDEHGVPWLIVQDGGFWTVMIRLTDDDLAELAVLYE